jgi:spore maturation protein CgeB
VHGQEQVEAINRGRLYLSFARTDAGYDNVKVGLFEAAACGACVIANRLAESERYFTSGLELLVWSRPEELVDLVRYYLDHERVRRWIGENARLRCLAEHTWADRWRSVLAAVDEIKERCAAAGAGMTPA